MVLELHVWGPSFGLPSIDAQCLATVAYMRQVIPRGQWFLVASSDPTLSPTNELPALRNSKNGDWIGGYRNILDFVTQYSSGKWDMDASLRGQEGADCTAYSAFIQVHGQPLLDLSLYVSSHNYSEITRPIFNTIQSFPLPYLTPPHLRTGAKKRTEYLGLSSLDIDTEDGDKSREPSIIPESLRRGKQTVSSLLAASPETNAQIRLDALATDFFESIQELKGKKEYLVSNDHMSSIDCLALGFMSLMLYPNLPQPWLAKTMREKFPDLVKWVEELKNEVFGGVVNVDDAMLTKSANANAVQQKKMHLPWQAPEISCGEETGKDTGNQVWRYVATVGGLVAAVGLVTGYALHQGLIQLPENWPGKKDNESEKIQGLSDLGEAGQALFAFADQMDSSVQRQRELKTRNASTVEVDVDLGQDGIVRDRLA
ncbi:hypothetical protein DID88_009327 [Monilinia fructigena]|uniref:Mitochondrial outer membrane transport complex Sam37/metaxin N-terminal domain-containing protein n=1 Tax=Monilinia fructigena TaxID=38457 RepID=A0A395IEU8_9HELO|nr:hypothetical protein DID88_009327 [Monilinia fructigena]